MRAREMEVEAAYPLGSHTLFVAKIVSEEQLAYKPQFFDMHGLYFARSGDKASVKLRDGTAAFPRGLRSRRWMRCSRRSRTRCGVAAR